MKRLLSLILSLALAVSMFSGITVFARELPAADELTAREIEEEQLRAEEEAHRVEVEQRRAEEEQRRAEEEKRREEEKNRRDERLRAMGIDPDEKLDPDNLPTRPPVPGAGEVTAADSGYSEVVYISTPEELMAIDGHDGGYYELQNDIDITGIEWKPLTLYNATFNGNNHAINGLTITKEPEYYIDPFDSSKVASIGLFTSFDPQHEFETGKLLNNYYMDLNLTNININLTKTHDGMLEILGLGEYESFADSCKTSGAINFVDLSQESLYNSSALRCITNGYNCENSIDINMHDGVVFNSMNVGFNLFNNCVNCTNYGNITITAAQSSEQITGGSFRNIMLDCSNCISFTGINGYYGDAMYECSDCIIYGDVIGRVNTTGIGDGCENCIIYGDIISENGNTYGIDGGSGNCIYGNITSKNSYIFGIDGGSGNCIYGNITSENSNIYAIHGGSNNYIEGNITSENSNTYGIGGGSGNYIKGNITSENVDDWTYGIGGGSNNYIEGNITSKGDGDTYGIDVGSGNCIEGNITATNGGASGIGGGSNNYIQGNITATNGGAYGIGGSDNYIQGNITATNGSASGISGGSNNYIQGSVTATNGDARGISNGTNCYISGIVRENPGDGTPTLTASASSPFMGYFKCSYDSSSLISTRDISGRIHCYGYDSSNTPYERGSYWCKNDVYYIYPLEGGGGSDPDATIPPIPTPEPQATREPSAYSLRVTDEVSGDPVSGATVYIDGASYETDDSGVVQFKNSNRTAGIRIDYGGAPIYTDAGFFLMPNQMSEIKVKAFDVDPEDLFAGNSEDTRLQGPAVKINNKSVYMLDVPFNFDLNLFNIVKTAYNAEDRTFQVLIGGSGDLGNVPEDADSEEWQDTYEAYREVFAELAAGKEGDAFFKQKNGPKTPGKLGVEGSVSVCGFMEISLDDESMKVLSGGITVILDGSVSNSYPLPPVPAVYISYGVSGSLQSGLKWEIMRESPIAPEFNMSGQVDLSITPSVGVGLGVRKLLSLEVGIEGEGAASLKAPITKLEECLTVTLTARFYALYTLLGKEFRQSQKLTGAQIYPYFEAAEAADIDIEPENMTTVQRDYLETAETAADADTVKSNLYPYSQVRLVDLSDGRTMMVWLDDDTSRALADKTALYYSILENGTWSEPKIIDDDGTADFEFDITASSNGAAIVWQSANRKLSESEDVYKIAKTVDIKYAEFDGTAWSEPKSITSGDKYEYSPRIEAGNYTTYICYTENDKDSPMPGADETSESVYLSRIENGEIGETTAALEKLPLVCDSAVYNGNAYIIADKDGDMTTSENILYRGGEVLYDNNTELSGLHKTSGGLAFTENGNLKRISDSITDITDTKAEGSVMYLSNYGKQAAVFEAQDGFNSNLYASYNENGNWTNPVKITDYNAKIRSWDARLDQNGEIQTAAVLADTDDSGSTTSARLVYTHTEPEEDIAVNAIYADGAVTPGKSARFDLDITNNTKADLSSLNIRLEGEKSGVIFEGAQSVNIPAGESGEASVSVMLPEGFEKQNITAAVTGEGLSDKNTANNAAANEFGAANLTVEIKDYKVYSDGTAEAYVTNEGCETASGAKITVKGENGEIIIDEEIGEIAGGETKKITINLDPKYYTFADGKGSSVIKAEVSCGTTEKTQNDNSGGCVIKPQAAQMLRSETKSLALKPGASFKPNITAYPESVTDFPIYVSSDNEDVASVSEDGTITAKNYGDAVITYMTPGAAMSAKVRVYVRESSAPTITNAEYTQYEENSGELRVSVDTSGCLSAGETETLMIAAYGEDGTLAGFTTADVTGVAPTEEGTTPEGAISETFVQISGAKPKKVKVMIWNSTKNIMPMSEPAEKEL